MEEVKRYNDMEIGVDPILASPPDNFTAEELYEYLCEYIINYHPSINLELIEKAYKLALEAHGNQKRKSGEPYIIHPLRVAIILSSLELDKESIVAGILHDVVEDTDYTYEDIAKMFNKDVADLVDGVTKLGQVSIKKDKIEMQAENLRKMFLAMSEDIRVILIKLADRLHNMRTLQFMTREKQIEKAKETQDIYAPLAHRLGIFKIKVELDDLCLRYLEPDIYFDLVEKLNEREMFRHEYIANIIKDVRNHMVENGINCNVYGRVKHIFSIYKKMLKKDKSLDNIYDLFAVRIVVNTTEECYAVLGCIHAEYKTMSNRFKDYISVPKPNMYQSIHTTVFGKGAIPFEIQIRTKEMHRIAEYGIAAHWVYKENGSLKAKKDSLDEKLTWLRQIIEMQQNTKNDKEFISMVKDDLNVFSDKVYVFTPEGDVKILKAGAITVDFAYSVHSAVGNKMVGARVNNNMVPIDYVLKNSDIVEIITSNNSSGPSLDWLNKVVTSQAKTKINQWFKSQNKEENIIKGRNLITNYCKLHNVSFNNIYIK